MDSQESVSVLKAVREALLTGEKPSELPDELRQDPLLVEVLDTLLEMQSFTAALAAGDFSVKLKRTGPLAKELKALRDRLFIGREQNEEELSRLKTSLEYEKALFLRSETTLRDSEEKFRSFVEQSKEGIALADENGKLFIWNHAQEQITGIQAEEARKKFFWEVVPELFSGEQREKMKKLAVQDLQKVMREGSLKLDDQLYEVVITRPDGTRRVVECLHLPIHTTKGILFGNIVRDITDIREMETSLLGNQKMAMLGTLTAGIAHEFNTPLQVITGISNKIIHSISSRQVSADELTRWAEIIHESGWRLAEIVHSLQMCADPTGEEKRANSLNAVVKDSLLLIQDQLSSWTEISVYVKLDETLPELFCNRNQITQAFLNLISNAHDALALLGGEIQVETGRHPLKQRIFLRVTDNGAGIPPEAHQRIFDPFFSTKPVGSGAGLGLSLVMAIVQAHQGEIGLEDLPQGGTSITLYFPETPPRNGPQEKIGRLD